MDPEDPGLVARRRDDAPGVLAAAAPDDHRPAAQLRPVALFDGREEGIEIDVQDRSRGHARYHRPAVEPPVDDAGAEPPLTGAERLSAVDWPSPATAAGVLIAIAVGAAVAFAVPLSAIVLVWPILFFVPGWVVIRRVVPDLPRRAPSAPPSSPASTSRPTS